VAKNVNRVVSSDNEELILVDLDDNEIGSLAKSECHRGNGILHRAFSIFLFDRNGDLLMQKRSAEKRLWPGYWSNSCCSHPRKGETLAVATRRRLMDELNVSATLEFVYRFDYTARFQDAGSENELCSVYVGRAIGDVHANGTEISELRYISSRDLRVGLEAAPQTFTPWFKLEWSRLSSDFAHILGRYTSLA